jgi:sugar-specific transcriptional regulator TrmB
MRSLSKQHLPCNNVMQINTTADIAHLTYCSNIHAGESWGDIFGNLRRHTTQIRDRLNADSLGIGLRISNVASIELLKKDTLSQFKKWLDRKNMYVCILNGFPYGDFNKGAIVKDRVHAPDWTNSDRLVYTKRLFDILSQLLPDGIDGGVSSSPISYRHWHPDEDSLRQAKKIASERLAELIVHLIELKQKTRQSLHLDMEVEPDGIIETSEEFIEFFDEYMLKEGIQYIVNKLNCSSDEAERSIREHFQLCYDVCHFAVEFEKPKDVLSKILNANVRIGRMQISAALRSGSIDTERDQELIKNELSKFDESSYLHQTVIQSRQGRLHKFRDLRPALDALDYRQHLEVRTHFHVPVFINAYGTLSSTQADITEALALWKDARFTNHLEIETYTWDVLPSDLQTNMVAGITRELNWVRNHLNNN